MKTLDETLTEVEVLKKASEIANILFDIKNPYEVVPFFDQNWELFMESVKSSDLTVDEMNILSKIVDKYNGNID